MSVLIASGPMCRRKTETWFCRIFVQRLLQLLVVAFALSSGQQCLAADIEWNGFGSLYYGQTANGSLRPEGFQDSSADFGAFSLFGLNVSGRISDKLSVAAQFLAQPANGATGANGLSEWGLSAKWAFATYEVNGDLSVKLGRQLLPFFIASEYESVGYLLPYRRIPTVFTATLANALGFNGIGADYKLGLGDSGKLTFSVFGGREDYPDAVLAGSVFQVSSTDLLGATVTFDGDGYRAHLQLSRSNPRVGLVADPGQSWYGPLDTLTVGARYDKNRFVAWTEFLYMRTANAHALTATPGEIDFANNTKGGYVLVGYRVHDWLPRYTYTQVQSTYGELRRAQVHNLGLNYQLSAQSVLKIDYEYYHYVDPLLPFGVAPGQTGSKTTVVYAGIDFIF